MSKSRRFNKKNATTIGSGYRPNLDGVVRYEQEYEDHATTLRKVSENNRKIAEFEAKARQEEEEKRQREEVEAKRREEERIKQEAEDARVLAIKTEAYHKYTNVSVLGHRHSYHRFFWENPGSVDTTDTREKMMADMGLSEETVYHTKCRHQYHVRRGSHIERQLLEAQKTGRIWYHENIGGCRLCWKQLSQPKDGVHNYSMADQLSSIIRVAGALQAGDSDDEYDIPLSGERDKLDKYFRLKAARALYKFLYNEKNLLSFSEWDELQEGQTTKEQIVDRRNARHNYANQLKTERRQLRGLPTQERPPAKGLTVNDFYWP